MNIKKYVSTGIMLATMTTAFAVAIPAFADSTSQAPTAQSNGEWKNTLAGRRPMMRPAVLGTVSAISGNTVTVSGRQGFGTTTPITTFTVDATNATVTKNNVASTVANITVGDTVLAQGTVSGNTVTATMIRDGVVPGRGMGMKGGQPSMMTRTNAFTGDGQPVVAGTVSTVSGNTLTVTNKSNMTYTVNAATAKIIAGRMSSTTPAATIATITVGDNVIVQGAINGTTITATSVIDQKPAPSTSAGSTKPAPHGIFGNIGSFFSHLFGF